MTIFLLCDFGRLNLKNLKKLPQVYKDSKLSAKAFQKESGLRNIAQDIHDGLEHRIPFSVKKYLPNQNQISYKNKTDFLPLVARTNQSKEVNDEVRNTANYFIEKMTAGMRGAPRAGLAKAYPNTLEETPYIIGRALRKRNLTQAEKLATGFPDQGMLKTKIMWGTIDPSKETIMKKLISMKPKASVRNPKKTPGIKPTPLPIEEKQLKLKQKYGVI